jgi:protein gp37
MSKSTIEWTELTWNPVTGCDKISAGCKNCYAEVMHRRLQGMFPEKYSNDFSGGVQCHEDELYRPLSWKKPSVIFVNSMSDLFHKDVPFEFIALVFLSMAKYDWHTYQVLTKRADRMLEFFQWIQSDAAGIHRLLTDRRGKWPLPNVWIGVSCEDQRSADDRMPLLFQCPAAVRFLSCEPLLGPIDLYLCTGLNKHHLNMLHWVIAGGESGHKARPTHPAWARSLRDQCKAADVPFFFKQWGSWSPVAPITKPEICNRKPDADVIERKFVRIDGEKHSVLIAGHEYMMERKRGGKKQSGNCLDGVQHLQFPQSSKNQFDNDNAPMMGTSY